MNWFERYGIPGAYFYGLFFVWATILNPDKMPIKDIQSFVGLGLLTFIPIGYILTIFQQFIYMKWFGMLGKIDNRNKEFFPKNSNNEWKREAFFCFYASGKEEKNIDKLKYTRDHSRKRMDVIAINYSILSAKLIFLIMALILFFGFGWKIQCKTAEAGIFSAVFILATILLWRMNRRLKEQVKYLLELMITNYKKQ